MRREAGEEKKWGRGKSRTKQIKKQMGQQKVCIRADGKYQGSRFVESYDRRHIPAPLGSHDDDEFSQSNFGQKGEKRIMAYINCFSTERGKKLNYMHDLSRGHLSISTIFEGLVA